jgi:carboxylate-amine ligase
MVEVPFAYSELGTVGVELELQLVDSSTLALQCGINGILAELSPALLASVRRELHGCCIEIATGVCRSVNEVSRDLTAKLRSVGDAAAKRGLLLGWGGTHPFSHWKDQEVTDVPRYRALAKLYREALLRQVTFGLHVHVGVVSGDAAVRTCDRMRDHLPILLALSANSPYWCGRATGLQSQRIEVMGSLPMRGIPPGLGDWDSYLKLVSQLMTHRIIASLKDLWWDVRPSPTNGTVEVRICDLPLGPETVLGLTALIQCLVFVLSSEKETEIAGRTSDSHVTEDLCHSLTLRQNRWLASRFGLDAILVHPLAPQQAPAGVLARAMIDRLIDVGQELGCSDYLQNLKTRSRGPNGASAQMTIYSRTNRLEEVVRLMTRADSSVRWHSTFRSLAHDRQVLDPLRQLREPAEQSSQESPSYDEREHCQWFQPRGAALNYLPMVLKGDDLAAEQRDDPVDLLSESKLHGDLL